MAYSDAAQGAIGDIARALSLDGSVGAPVVVEGRLWGVIQAGWSGEESPPADTEKRMARFAGLLETAIANADNRDRLTASRVCLLTEGDEARRRVVRDLHDGAQQRLVHAIITLELANRAFQQNQAEKAEALVAEALEHAQQGNTELRDLAHGILPADLTRGGLRAGVRAIAARFELPVEVEVPAQRLPAEIERSAYFIMAESLTNVVKHSQAEGAEVRAFVDDGMLHVEVRDDGVGGADPDGHGLIGLRDRATALGGQLNIDSPPGGGTLVVATLPLSEG
jgi:signal transduction histidine kinase